MRNRWQLEGYAIDMRREPTKAELRLHNALVTAFEPYDVNLKHQEPISYWIADFMLYPHRIVIEVDGATHSGAKAKAYDDRRDAAMRQLGIRIIRISNVRVFTELAKVVEEIVSYCQPMDPKRDRSGEPQVTICPPASGFKPQSGSKRRWQNRLAFNARFPKR